MANRNPHLPNGYKRRKGGTNIYPLPCISKISPWLCCNKELEAPGAVPIISAEIWITKDNYTTYWPGCVINPDEGKIYYITGSEVEATNLKETIDLAVKELFK